MSDDYEQRFPEDPMLEETAANSRVWRTYLVESAVFDENMVEEARDGLDAMLVFVRAQSNPGICIQILTQCRQAFSLQLSPHF